MKVIDLGNQDGIDWRGPEHLEDFCRRGLEIAARAKASGAREFIVPLGEGERILYVPMVRSDRTKDGAA